MLAVNSSRISQISARGEKVQNLAYLLNAEMLKACFTELDPNKAAGIDKVTKEEYARNHRESYDIAIARAVASLNVLLELCLPLVKVNGYFIAMKGAKGFEEIEEAKNALKELDSEIVEIMEVNLPESGEKRILILIQKKKKTKSRYPREYKDISNKPL